MATPHPLQWQAGGRPGSYTVPAECRAALELMRDIGHGRIEDLCITRGIPHITPRTKPFQRYRPGHAEPPPVPPPDYTGRRPHPQHIQFLEHCRGMDSGVIERVEVADGLPVYWGTHGSPRR